MKSETLPKKVFEAMSKELLASAADKDGPDAVSLYRMMELGSTVGYVVRFVPSNSDVQALFWYDDIVPAATHYGENAGS